LICVRIYETLFPLVNKVEMSRIRRIKAPRSAPSVRPLGRRTLVALGGLLALCYWNTFDVPFHFDDRARIEENADIRQLWPLSVPMKGSNRPLGMYTFAVNYALHNYRVGGYHATNLVIHILAGLTLFGIVRRTLTRTDLADRSATCLAFAIALIWLVHPLNTQAVTYTVQRLESLMGLCYLATLYCFIRAQDSPRRTWWYAASIACYAVGMGIKEVMVTAPVMVVWYHRVFISNSWRVVFREHWCYYMGLFSTWGILVWCMLRTQIEYSKGNIAFVEGLTPLSYLLSQAGVITHYLRLSVWPFGQCLDYGWPVAETAREIIPPLLFIGALAIATVWAVFRHPAWGFLGGWFFVLLAPTSSFVPIVDLAFEQRMYLPLAAVVTLTVVGGYKLLQRNFGRIAVISRRPLISRWVGANVAGAVFVAAVAVATHRRNDVYASEQSLWTDVVTKRPNNARGHSSLGHILQGQGKFDLAAERYREAIRLVPDYAQAYNNLGNALQGQGHFDLAIDRYREAIRLKPGFAEAYNNLGYTLQHQGKFDLAVAQYLEAIRLNPNCTKAHNNLAAVRQVQGNAGRTVERVDANRLTHDDAEACYNRGNALQNQGQLDLAVKQYDQAIRLEPDHADARYNLGRALQGQKKFDQAVEQYREAIRLTPGFAEAYYNRSIVYFQLRAYDEAWADCCQL
jgi:tetratricopeptide (TPR) repeat protein